MELIKTFLSQNKQKDLIYNEVYFNYTLQKYQLFNTFVDKNILNETWIEYDKISSFSEIDISKIDINNNYDILFLYQILISYYGFIEFGVNIEYDYILLHEYRVNLIKENSQLNYCKILTIGYN